MVWNCRTVFHPSFSSQFCNWDYYGMPCLLENSSFLPSSKLNTRILQDCWMKAMFCRSPSPSLPTLGSYHHQYYGLCYESGPQLYRVRWGPLLPIYVKEWSDRSNPSHPGCSASLITGEAIKESLQGNINTFGPAELLGFFNQWFLLPAYQFWPVAAFPIKNIWVYLKMSFKYV